LFLVFFFYCPLLSLCPFSFVCSLDHLSICLFICSSVHLFSCSSVDLLICWSVDLLICWSVDLLIHWSVQPISCSFVGLFICSVVHLFICSSVWFLFYLFLSIAPQKPEFLIAALSHMFLNSCIHIYIFHFVGWKFIGWNKKKNFLNCWIYLWYSLNRICLFRKINWI
jgi:hypothetical protein